MKEEMDKREELALITAIREEIFRLAKQAENVEIMHWYMWLDDCFENDEFHKENAKTIRYRLWVLIGKGEPVKELTQKIERLLQAYKFITADGRWHDETPPYMGKRKNDILR